MINAICYFQLQFTIAFQVRQTGNRAIYEIKNVLINLHINIIDIKICFNRKYFHLKN